jgi:hypothetical protein
VALELAVEAEARSGWLPPRLWDPEVCWLAGLLVDAVQAAEQAL